MGLIIDSVAVVVVIGQRSGDSVGVAVEVLGGELNDLGVLQSKELMRMKRWHMPGLAWN